MFNIKLSKISISDLKKYTKFIVIFAAILFLVGGYFLWFPKYQDFRKNAAELDVESEKVRKKKEYILELENSLANLSAYQEELLKISSALPLEYSPSSLFSFVQRTGSGNGLIVKAADLSVATKETRAAELGEIQIDVIGITVTLTGTYPSFKDFISESYKTSRLVEIESISIAPAEIKTGEEAPSGLFDFKLGIYANYYNKIE